MRDLFFKEIDGQIMMISIYLKELLKKDLVHVLKYSIKH